jgi:aryl-alcohol dehydrogenase-like predicted oxidoreductase
MEYRQLGRTGIQVSAVGFGGAPIGLSNYLDRWDAHDAASESEAVAAVHRALDVGITYFDTARSYGEGRSEDIYGKALRLAGAAGKHAIVATKTSKRDPHGITESAEASLAALGRETIDVLQFHGSRWTDEDAAAVLDGGGADAFEELRRQGKVRFIGFTAETGSPGTYRLLRSDRFDVMQIAYNVLYQDACNLMIKAGPMIEAKERGLGVVTMRSLSSGVFQKLLSVAMPSIADQVDLYSVALRFVLSNPYLDCALVGMRTAAEAERNAALAADGTRFDVVDLHRRYVDRV